MTKTKLNGWQIAMLEKAMAALQREYEAKHGDNAPATCDVRKLAMLIEDAGAIHVTPWED